MSKKFIILIIIACLIIGSFITVGLLVLKVNKDRGNHLQKYEENIHGKRALIVYQPSITALTNKVVDNIANGLKSQGINVDINYAGSHIGNDLSHYDIIIYGSPSYAGNPLSIVKETIENVSMYAEDVEIYLFAVGAIEETDILNSLENALDISSISQKKFTQIDLEDAVDWGRQIGK
jgi:Flavodoxin